MDYGRFSTNTDNGSSGISDKPTGDTKCGFCCTAYRTSDYGNEDQYFLTCYCHDDNSPYVAVVSQNAASITWSRIPNTFNTQNTSSTVDTYSTKYTEDHFQAKDTVYTFTKTLNGTSKNWTDTGITNADLPTGTYAMQIELTSGKIGLWNPVYSATIAWQNRVSNDSRTNEILLMHMGHADNGAGYGQRLFLRVLQQTSANAQKLQYAFRLYYDDTTTATFKFRRLI
jgi:hypothetical protein